MIDKKLVNMCIDGDRKAQKQFYYRHLEALKIVGCRYAVDSSEAKDVLQNAFLRIFSKLSDADLEKQSLVPWMRRIVINEALRLKRDQYVELKEESGHHMINPVIIESALNSLEVQDLLSVIDDLPFTFKTVFQLKEVEGYSHKEIASMLKIETSTSRSILTRSKIKLKSLLEKHYSVKKDKIEGHGGF